MNGNIIFINRYFLSTNYRCAAAKRVLNQAAYLRNKFDVLIITFSSCKSELNYNRNFHIPQKNRILYSLIIPFYWIKIFFILLKRKNKDGNNYLLLETCVNFYSMIPLVFAKILGYKVIQDILEDFSNLQEHLSFKQKLHFRMQKLIHSGLRSYADGIIVISNRLYNKYEKLNVPIIKLYNSVESKTTTTIISNPDNIFTFFYSGTFSTKDGVLDLIKAFNIVEKKFPEARLVLVGKGDFSSFHECMTLIKNKIKIIYLGYVSESRMFHEISNSNVCCVTRTNSEYANSGFPFKLAEYLSFGKPILSTSVSDIPALFTDKKNILLAEPENPESISQVMEYAITNRNEILRIGENGKKICENLFSIENIGKKLSDFVLQLT